MFKVYKIEMTIILESQHKFVAQNIKFYAHFKLLYGKVSFISITNLCMENFSTAKSTI